MSINFSFPFKIDPYTHQTQCASDEKETKDSIYCILLTNLKERVMLASFGSRIKDYIFEPLDANLIEALKKEIYDSLHRNGVSLEHLTIEFTTSKDDIHTIISYESNAHGIQEIMIPLGLQKHEN